LTTGLSSTELACFQTVNNKVYFCDSAVFKVTDGTTANNAAITRPAAAPTLGLSGAVGSSNPKGTYDYKYTYYSSSWGQESFSSDASATVLPDGQTVTVAVVASSDARVTNIRIYRRKVSALESSWRYVTDVANTTNPTVPDTALDNNLSLTRIAPLSVTDSFPSFRFLAYQAGVLFCAGGDPPTRLYYSRADEPWIASEYLEIGSGGDTDAITGLAAFQGLVVVFKERSIWTVSGNSTKTFFVRRVHVGVGCLSHHSIVEADGALYFRGEQGFYAFNGEVPVDISSDQRATFTDLNYSRRRFIVGVHDYENGAIRWSYSSAGVTTNDSQAVYFYRNSQRVEQRSWSPWSCGNVSYYALVSDKTTRKRMVATGLLAGHVLTDGGTSDNGAAYEFKWRTGMINMDEPGRRKIWRELAIESTPQAATSNLNVNAYLDSATSSVSIGTHTQVRDIFRRRISRSSKDLRIEVQSNAIAAPSEIQTWTLDAELAGRY
jgi:hypothetical protein